LTEKRQFRKSKDVIENLEIIEDKSDNKRLESALKKLEEEFTLEQNTLLKAFSKHVGKIKEELEEVKKKTESDTKSYSFPVYPKSLKHLQKDIDDLEHELEELKKFVLSSINTLQKIGETLPRLSLPKKIISFDNPNRREISNVSTHGRGFTHLHSDYTRYFDIRKFPLAWGVVKRKLKGQILIDLGSGGDTSTVTFLARETKVAKYFGVDMNIQKESHGIIDGLEVNHFGGDMLQFCSKLTTNSCNFVMNGIDFLDKMGGNYLGSLIAEITRATRRGGIVFGRGSEPVVEELRNAHKLFTEVEAGSYSNDHFLFIKN